MIKFKQSEFILNADGSIYHLNLKPEHVSDTIIFVGDPDRVSLISRYFDTIEFEIQKREFKTCTGNYQGLRLTVISTGIGTDNIDIVLNELDALVNVDFNNRTVKEELTKLNIIRIGTSGALQKNIPVDSFLLSTYSLGLDGLLHYYDAEHIHETDLEKEFLKQTQWSSKNAQPYITKGSSPLTNKLLSSTIKTGCTTTAPGFYGPQGRTIRLELSDPNLMDRITSFHFNDIKITNLEMETSAIYGLSKLMGHEAISLNAILANRVTGEFSTNPEKTIDSLIKYTLEKLVKHQ